jgi:hypothetical protein
MSKTRWPERYGAGWTPDEFNTQAAVPKGKVGGLSADEIVMNPAYLARTASELTAEFEAKGIEMEAFVRGNGLLLRGPYIDDDLSKASDEADV